MKKKKEKEKMYAIKIGEAWGLGRVGGKRDIGDGKCVVVRNWCWNILWLTLNDEQLYNSVIQLNGDSSELKLNFFPFLAK